jgi:hypothetical protein
MSFNVDGLYYYTKRAGPKPTMDRLSRRNLAPYEKYDAKPPYKIDWIARIINEYDPDVFFGVEIESYASFETFNQDKLNSRYAAFVFEGNTPKDVKVGFLIKKDLPFSVEFLSHREATGSNALYPNERKVFGRDVPVALIRTKGKQAPMLAVIGIHAASFKVRPGDPTSAGIRNLQYEATKKIIKNLLRKYGAKLPIVLTGDFNVDTRTSNELKPLHQLLSSAFNFSRVPVAYEERITHSFHPDPNTYIYWQADDFFITQNLRERILAARVLHYVDPTGRILALPTSIEARKELPSDHRPILLDIGINLK